jgi:uncharacterized protein affecting Mg2+/Co2+ transport
MNNKYQVNLTINNKGLVKCKLLVRLWEIVQAND